MVAVPEKGLIFVVAFINIKAKWLLTQFKTK